MKTIGRLPYAVYSSAGASVPILCVDAILVSPEKGPRKFLLVKRRLRPFAGKWWVPGGRVWRGEKLIEAFRRIVRVEVGIELHGTPRLFGVYELRHDGDDDIPGGRHTVSVVFGEVLPKRCKVRIDEQSSDWKWSEKFPKRFTVWGAS